MSIENRFCETMGSYLPGDVILVSASIGNRSDRKVRPAVVVFAGDDGEISVCAVSSKPSSDAICIPLSIDDFASGGLDLFSESLRARLKGYYDPER